MEDATPSDVLRGRREDIPPWRSKRQLQTIDRRRRHNRALKEPTRPQSGPWTLDSQRVPNLLVANSRQALGRVCFNAIMTAEAGE